MARIRKVFLAKKTMKCYHTSYHTKVFLSSLVSNYAYNYNRNFMIRVILVTLVILTISVTSFAEVPINIDNRIINTDGYSCGWCALETLARQQDIKELYGIRDLKQNQRRSISTPESIATELDNRNVSYTMNRQGNKDIKFLTDHLSKGKALAVGIGRFPIGHVTILTFLDKDTATLVNNKTTIIIDREQFLKDWDGWALTLNNK